MPIQFDPQLGNHDLLLRQEIFDAGNALHDGLHFLQFRPEHIQVVAIQLDRHLRLDPGKHGRNQVRQRLFHAGDNPGDVRHGFANLVQDLFPFTAANRIKADDKLGHVDADHVLVELSSARAGDESLDPRNLLEPPLDDSGDLLGALQRGARRQEDIQLRHTFVKWRHEVAFHSQQHRDADTDRHQRGDQDGHGHAKAPADHPPGQDLEPAKHKAFLLAVRGAGVGQEPVGQHRGHRQRDHQRGQDGHDVGDPQRREQPPFHPAQRKQRDEDQHDDQGAERDRVADFRAGLEHDQQRRLGLGTVPVLPQAAVDVLHVHDGIVDQLADGHSQTAQGHRVDRHAKPLEHQSRDDNRQRDGRQGDERGPEIEEKKEQDDRHQDAAVAQGSEHVCDCQIDELLLLVQARGDADIRRQGRAQFLQGGLDVLCQPSGIRARLLVDRQDHGWSAGELAILAERERGAITPFHLRPFDNPGDLLQQHGAPIADLDDQLLQVFDRLDAPRARTRYSFGPCASR